MYRIVKRIVRTVTTVTLLVRWEKDSPGQDATEMPITLPASVSLTEEEVTEQTNQKNAKSPNHIQKQIKEKNHEQQTY
jgi:hypothetical protein